ncbi:hypothetical protein G6F16_013802 [Rhizopus arrhizus]|nr:hypothetical protein G6F16_013802 [Rhizopus arrhizus]KAG0880060.1 hypothetical protein G6F34_013850 [Rhizopus arrhizus]KAG1060238.1 hypothetical protein G6F42_028036 [Rhizopus arrhizus]KAG1387330.1 hypothetical protein G6F60_014156 [Rhizopus arrhizus]
MASHLASVFDGSLLPSTRPPPPSSPSSLGLPLGLHGSSPSGTSPSGSSGPPCSSHSLFAPLTIYTFPNLNQIEQTKHYFEEKTLLYF